MEALNTDLMPATDAPRNVKYAKSVGLINTLHCHGTPLFRTVILNQ